MCLLMPLIPEKPIFLRFCNKDRKDSYALTITEQSRDSSSKLLTKPLLQ